jgi:hypothetical protein
MWQQETSQRFCGEFRPPGAATHRTSGTATKYRSLRKCNFVIATSGAKARLAASNPSRAGVGVAPSRDGARAAGQVGSVGGGVELGVVEAGGAARDGDKAVFLEKRLMVALFLKQPAIAVSMLPRWVKPAKVER